MWNKITRCTGVRYRHVLSGPALTLSVFLLISASGMSTGYAVGNGNQAKVSGLVLESSCDVQVLDDKQIPQSEYRAVIEDQSVSTVQGGGVYGLWPVRIQLSGCQGVVLDDKYSKTVGVSVTGPTTTTNHFLFRTLGGGQENDADQRYGFAITKTAPVGKTMPWNTGDLIENTGLLPSVVPVVDLHNKTIPGTITEIPFWLGISCGDSSGCSGIPAAVGGSLKADIVFTFAYQ
ncbi:Uncharacterised protein [Serratia fonticola]|uniref:hypothetical protein n=1 Tax=Serratia fonticola TaxID=47917 RepID=UPI002178CD6A|nr:hypothetical protein [Serratia fonticola]CAI1731468.1 Uncharacterised protein [Serratia fonticola]CAI1908401.1 Uncharacterised protein [Serratia fonticola]